MSYIKTRANSLTLNKLTVNAFSSYYANSLHAIFSLLQIINIFEYNKTFLSSARLMLVTLFHYDIF